MGDDPCFTYWVVDCKTPDCGTIVLDVIGPCDLRRVVYLPVCRNFEITCAGCMKTYVYSRGDVRSENALRQPISADRNSSFQAAIQPEPRLGEE